MSSVAEILKMGRGVPHKETLAMIEAKVGPFHPEVLVRCPLINYAGLPPVRCTTCHFYAGVRERVIHGKFDRTKGEHAAKAYMVECTHPITRALVHLPRIDVKV